MMPKPGYGPSLVADPAFSFEASLKQSIEEERLDAGLDVGPAGALSRDAVRRAYDLAFGTSPLTSPSTSTRSSRTTSPCPPPRAPDPTPPASQPHSPPSTSPTPPSGACFSTLFLECEQRGAYGPPQASQPQPAAAAKTKTRTRKRKRAAHSSTTSSEVKQPPASLPSIPTARFSLNTNGPALDIPHPASSSHPPLPPPTTASAEGAKRPSKVLRDKNKGRTYRRNARREAKVQDPRTGRTPRLATVLKHIAPAAVMETKMDISKIPSASTGFMALPDHKGRVYTLQELVDVHKFKVIKWDGITSRAIVDSNDLVIAVLAGRPGGGDSWAQACEAAFRAMQEKAQNCKFAQDDKDHRRGNFAVLNAGISFGGGAMLPGNLYHGRTNKKQLKDLLSHDAFIRIAGFQCGVFKAWAPKLYDYYETHLDALLERHPKLQRNFDNSVWAACAINFGPRTVTTKHRDFHNLPFGLCAVTALGHFDPTKGGHIVIWELKLIIEFPPGSTILLPSAVVAHSNTPISPGETRASFTQYSAGGLFRWTEHGFQLEPDFEATLSDEQFQEVKLQNAERCKLGLSLFSTMTELRNL